MARRRYYRRSVRVVAPKKKWATHFSSGPLVSPGVTLCENAPAGDVPTPVIIKCGNFKIQGDVGFNSTTALGFIRLMVFVAYVPEGYTVNAADIKSYHPEWIMGWTALDTNNIPASSPSSASKWSLSTRLKRNLNSGDKIMLFYDTTATVTSGINISYNAQYWTCSN